MSTTETVFASLCRTLTRGTASINQERMLANLCAGLAEAAANFAGYDGGRFKAAEQHLAAKSWLGGAKPATAEAATVLAEGSCGPYPVSAAFSAFYAGVCLEFAGDRPNAKAWYSKALEIGQTYTARAQTKGEKLLKNKNVMKGGAHLALAVGIGVGVSIPVVGWMAGLAGVAAAGAMSLLNGAAVVGAARLIDGPDAARAREAFRTGFVEPLRGLVAAR